MVSITDEKKKRIKEKLFFLYGSENENIYLAIIHLIDKFLSSKSLNNEDKKVENSEIHNKFSKDDCILNCYANSIQGGSNSPLKDLRDFFLNISTKFTGIHVLPFYEWDTDHGFSVLNYYNVDQRNGTWDDFTALNDTFKILMVDLVLNHASIDNPLVQGSLTGNPKFKDFVITYSADNKPSESELMKITRARPYPVLTEYFVIEQDNKLFSSFDKPKYNKIVDSGFVWTTFSREKNKDGTVATRQVDLNFSNPYLLLEILKIILAYIGHGATWIRLDAIGYLWKKIGTSCLHLPETHTVIELLSEIVELIDERIVLISEVNEPQENTLQYLGTADNKKSDMVYLFTHYPLAIHAVLTGTAKYYANWLPSLEKYRGKLFTSVLGTHDGMGMKPLGDWLPNEEKEKLQELIIQKHGGLPNYAKIAGGKKILYEICSTSWSLINQKESKDPISIQIDRFIVVFALGLCIKGVPSIYINGLFGISNYSGELDENRSINRQVLDKDTLIQSVQDKNSVHSRIFNKIIQLLDIRKQEDAFEFKGSYSVFNLHENVVSILLSSNDMKNEIFSITNVSNKKVNIQIEASSFSTSKSELNDLIGHKHYEKTNSIFSIQLDPYQICWLK